MGGRRLLMAATMMWAAAGCGSAVEGTAEPASGQEGLFDPCNDIPDDVLRKAGLDPATEEADIAGVEQPGWKICKWTEDWFFLNIMSTTRTIDEVRGNSGYVDVESVEIGGRSGIEFHAVNDPGVSRCFVAVQAEHGATWISVNTKATYVPPEPTCALTTTFAESLGDYLPK